ncbi:MAG: beta-ketoacyl-[acyl-carrier-protein] synthase family protein [Desulfobacteraceae bacterium]|nr:beta-ketoacyl-[acyl-carrier-protein] synthase family protein [Desulfobacteraceae bacterium]MBC2750575.1 beta-ketoacyl-[acyl-carrier-protein] synthase family protein [Desulfobacteraceae bacterium]
MTNRVVVSGLGMVTPLGTGKEDFAANLFAGRSGIGPITAFDTARFPSRLGASVSDFNPKDFISIKNRRRMDRLSLMATASARMALDDAGLAITAANRDRIGIILGVAYGSTDVAAQFMGTLFTEGPNLVSPILVPNTVMNAPAGHASIELGFRGINSTVNHHEASAETAIAYAAAEIQNGRADVLLAGGADIFSAFFFEILTHFKALSPVDGSEEGARPFDIQRNGPVVGEGAGVLCLESMAHALERGATPYCEIGGWGLSSSPAPPTDWPEDPQGPALAIQRALGAAGILPDQVDYVSASANGGRNLDRLEATALSRLFAGQETKPRISSIKGAVGESFSSGGIRAAAAALSIQERILPPTLGLTTPLQPLNFVKAHAIDMPVACALLNGFSSGGTFASLLMRSVDGSTDWHGATR